jgi:recombinational DNA repair protein (RecF pathway)
MLLRTGLHGGHEPGVYDLAGCVLDALCTNGQRLPLIFWFELRLAHELGLAPQLTRCTACGQALEQPGRGLFACDRGGLLCPRCAPRHAGKPLLKLAPDTLSLLRHWQRRRRPHALRALKPTRPQLQACRHVLGVFLQYYLDVAPPGRDAAIAAVEYRAAACPGR